MKNRSGLYNKETNKLKSLAIYGDGNTAPALARKKRQTIKSMNNGSCTGESTLKKYGITKDDILDITKIHVDVLNYFNLNEATLTKEEWASLSETVHSKLEVDNDVRSK
jgi:hypothetical protein